MVSHRDGRIFTSLVILDKSGSMSSIRTEAINGYNETLASIKSTQDEFAQTQEHFVSLAAFCGHGVEMIHDMIPIDKAEKLTGEQYRPCCMTPLFDAIGISVTKMRKRIADEADSLVIVTVITDGYENASKEWDSKTVHRLIEDCKEEGWTFSFIGAGEEVIKVASTISITNTMLWEATSEGTERMFATEIKARKKHCRLFEGIKCRMDADAAQTKIIKKILSESYYKEED